jgi:SseB protein C-terminal domain
MPPNLLSWLAPAWFRKIQRQQVMQVQTTSLRFLCEQDGPAERQIKAQWLPILEAEPHIRRAFLVRAQYSDQTEHVILALSSTGGSDSALMDALRIPYVATFRDDCPLDMAFINEAQQAHIEKVCRPFYTAA